VGKLDVRIIAHLTRKGKDFEAREFRSIGEIAELFLQDISKIMGKPIAFAGDAGAAAPPVAAQGAVSAAAQPPQLQSVQQMKSKVFQAQSAGFKDGVYVSEKGTDEPGVWQLVKFNGDMVELQKMELGRHSGGRSVQVDKLLESWRIHNGTVTALLPGYTFEDNVTSPLASAAWQFEAAKAAVTLALRAVYALMEPMGKNMNIFIKPVAVRPSVHVKAGQLMLAPATTHITRKSAPSSICVGKFELGGDKPEALYISPQFTAPLTSDGEPHKSPFVCPFWQVATVQGKSKANLQLKCFPYIINDMKVRVPILVNPKDIESDEELVWDKTSAAGFTTVRSEITSKDYEAAAKRRKINK
jgi:hypothetical protein